MATLQPAKAKEGSKERKQVVLVPNGLYSGLFAGYSLPKKYSGYGGAADEWKMFAWFVLTHDRTNTQLPRFSSALMTLRCVVPEGESTGVPKLFYNPETGLISAYTAFIYAMRGGKLSQEKIVENEEAYDLDNFLGLPAILFVKQGKPNDQKIITQKVAEIQPADLGVIQATKALYDAKKISFTEKERLGYLEYPAPVFLGENEPEGESEVTSMETGESDISPF